VRSTRWRSFLTVLGVIIAISSVITIVSIGEGIKHQVTNQVNGLGKDLITVRPGTISSDVDLADSLQYLNLISGQNASGLLTDQDIQTIESVKGVGPVAPLTIIPGAVSASPVKLSNPLVIATTNNIGQLLNQSLQYGGMYDNSGDGNVAVLGQGVSNRLFPGQVPLAQTYTFAGQTFTVRGEFNGFNSPPLSISADFNDAIFIPFSLATQFENGSVPIYEILVKPANPNQTNALAAAINAALLSAHGGVQNFTVLKQSQTLTITNGILNLLTELIAGIAAVSLLVGGIGIMNIMILSVTERTHEIGIRKAVGATSKQILGQFLVEAIMLSLIGGAIGVIVSLIINAVLRVLTNLQPVLDWKVMVGATLISLTVGIIFGIAPAAKAARKTPIEALRFQ
jgi:ABC-type antimicrobial peptide transport system permease subunit